MFQHQSTLEISPIDAQHCGQCTFRDGAECHAFTYTRRPVVLELDIAVWAKYGMAGQFRCPACLAAEVAANKAVLIREAESKIIAAVRGVSGTGHPDVAADYVSEALEALDVLDSLEKS
ncbi:MAG: hypothetical protein WC551_08620 [Patescibacteria group bacterium]